MAKLQKHTPPPGWKNPLAPQQPLTNPRWLAAGLAATLALAVVCVYLAFCLLFWQGQWQLVFKPSPAITATPASIGLKYDEIAFDATETGVLQLNGWWIPAGNTSPYAADTLLFMHDGSGSLSATVPQLLALHQLGINIFVFDYRGFGKSVHLHPSEASTNEDADAAWNYLVDTRHLPPSSIVLDGVGLGAAIAAETARRHPQAPAVILEDPRPPVRKALSPTRACGCCPFACCSMIDSIPQAHWHICAPRSCFCTLRAVARGSTTTRLRSPRKKPPCARLRIM